MIRAQTEGGTVMPMMRAVAAPIESLCLWYRQPAREWVEALPVGNGRPGAMVFSGVARERLQLNEDTLYAGGPYDPTHPDALAALPEVRRLVFAGHYGPAVELVGDKLMARPLSQMPYQTVGDMFLDFPGMDTSTDYRRELNLDTAVAALTYRADGARFRREIFASPADEVIVIRLTADRDFLAEAYPVMKGAAQFFLDTLVEEPVHGWLVTCPSLTASIRVGKSTWTIRPRLPRPPRNHSTAAATFRPAGQLPGG
jgi:hypothetical protein